MPVARYRSVEEMPRPWRDARDPGNLRLVARMLAFYRSLIPGAPRERGVRRFRTPQEASASLNDRYRR
jgi:hypothetical protein